MILLLDIVEIRISKLEGRSRNVVTTTVLKGNLVPRRGGGGGERAWERGYGKWYLNDNTKFP